MRRLSKVPRDANQLAAEVVRVSTAESTIAEYLAEIGRKGGLKGGKARAKKLSDKRRKEIAVRAARTRWKHHKG
jgi:hypothetical protein